MDAFFAFTTNPSVERTDACTDSIAVIVPGSRDFLKCHVPSILCYLPISSSHDQTESLVSRGIVIGNLEDRISSAAVIGMEFKSFQLDVRNFISGDAPNERNLDKSFQEHIQHEKRTYQNHEAVMTKHTNLHTNI